MMFKHKTDFIFGGKPMLNFLSKHSLPFLEQFLLIRIT